ncbi:ComEC/Rec2 family competence protein [Magnetospirillum sulfuroxidans]|uniref:ComEC/Rec2 family competence protein n=1 Tax=Magnetospirillum sulfuroxidans TaxID=611300 RepID=A0ABS5I8L2_9PROT|nr:ComEC/Rec2 family competence protein [Magnetospirillum sulfuroxidans]MBR9970772.1 ComEC/Rec2 family competence protein [Magnetospirillum sulfuroxidans]
MERLLAERERWPLWLPVFLGLGIAFYFILPSEPPAWSGPAILVVVLLAWLGLRRRYGAAIVLLPLLLAALGLSVAQMRTLWVQAPILEVASGKVIVRGVISEIEPMAEGGQRVVLEQVQADLNGPVPTKVRLRLKRVAPISVGAEIRLSALLLPPPQPLTQGAFDFARHAWFQGLGAVGSGLSDPEIIAPPAAGHELNRLRHRVALRVAGLIPGAAGGVAAALITGETSAIPRAVLNDYRDSGLAHLLSISGLHMSLLAGMAFFLVRGGLALVPAVALHYPIKKWAAALAMALTFLYMLLAGAPVPAQRAFLMTGIVLLAVLLDRAALSMRLVAWAAMMVLMVAPEALIGPSFQMSFAAVAALIATYEVAAKPMAAWRAAHRQVHHRLALYVAGLMLTSLVAGFATAFYGAFHFNRFAVWSLLANMVAVPLTGIAVMPFAMLSLLLMPLGLEELALVPMGWGVTAVNAVAAWVAALPGAAIALPPLPLWGMAGFTLGGLWLVLWRGSWRWWGGVPMLLGLSGFLLNDPPDLLVDGRGYAFGVRQEDGSLLVNRGGRMVRETWGRRAGPLATERWPKRGSNTDGHLTCAAAGCVYRHGGMVVGLIHREAGIDEACRGADVVISAVPLRGACGEVGLVIDRFDLWRQGAQAVWLESLRVESVAHWQGDRPWSHRPVRRRKNVDQSPTDDEKEAENDDS